MDPRYSNYPRANMAPGGGSFQMQRPPGAHFEFISDAFNIVRADLGTWILSVIVTLLVSVVAIAPIYALFFATILSASGGGSGRGSGAMTILQGGASLGIVLFLYVAVFAITLFMYVGTAAMGMQAVRGERPQIGELFAPFRRIVPVFATCFIVALLMMVGYAFFLLPGLIVLGLFGFAPLAAYEQNLGPGDALRWSFEASRPHMWGIIGLSIVSTIIASLGGCLCYVGYLFTGALPGIVLALMYLSFRQVAPPAASPFMAYPPAGPIAPPPTDGSQPPRAGL